jgi:integrase
MERGSELLLAPAPSEEQAHSVPVSSIAPEGSIAALVAEYVGGTEANPANTRGNTPKKLRPQSVAHPLSQEQKVLADHIVQRVLSAMQIGTGASMIAGERVVVAPEYGFHAFCTDPMLDAITARPGRGRMGPRTYGSLVRQLLQLGQAERLDDGNVRVEPPRWDDFKKWAQAHQKGRASLENQRYAMVWLSAYFGVPVPEWSRHGWDTAQDVARGKYERRMQDRTKFFRNVTDPGALIAADVLPKDDPRNRATFRTIAWTGFYCGPRSSEPLALRLGDIDWEQGKIRWPQPKKGYQVRDVQPPEPWALGDGPWPSLWWYVKNVRPQIDTEGRYGGMDAPVFLYVDERKDEARSWFDPQERSEGKERSPEHALSCWVAKRIREVLGPGSPGAHVFRRTCATYRVRQGWSLEAVAAYLDDTKGVVERAYLDRRFLNYAGIKRAPRGVDRPLLPRLMPNATYGIRSPANVPTKGRR